MSLRAGLCAQKMMQQQRHAADHMSQHGQDVPIGAVGVDHVAHCFGSLVTHAHRDSVSHIRRLQVSWSTSTGALLRQLHACGQTACG